MSGISFYQAAVCERSHSRKASSILACQPAPIARNAANTSGLYRTVTACLAPVLVLPTGRPRAARRIAAMPALGGTSFPATRHTACSKSAPPKSGASSGSTQGTEAFLFSFICFPHADNAAGRAALSPRQHHHATLQKAHSVPPGFSIVLASIGNSHARGRKHFTSAGKVQAPLSQGLVALFRVELNLHELNVTPFEGLTLAACTVMQAHGTISAKAKAPVRKNTPYKAVAAPTDKRGFVVSKICRNGFSRFAWFRADGLVREAGRTALYVFLTSAHPLRVRTHRVVLKSHKGATTMQVNPLGHFAPAFKAVPAITKTFALTEATTSINLAGFYVRRDNIAAARRKLRQALQALNALELAHV